MKDCIFCRIIKGEIPADFVYQDKDIVAFKDVNPLTPIHLQIIPRKHLEGIHQMKKGDVSLLGRMHLLAKKLAKERRLSGYKLYLNCGKMQEVKHLHLHLLGGFKGDAEFCRLAMKKVKGGGVS